MLTNFNNSITAAFLDELQKHWNNIYHFTSNLLPHYLAKIECSIAELFIHISQNNVRYTADVNVMLGS